MSFLEQFKSGNLVIPSALLFHYKDIFSNADEFLVWQFYYLQQSTANEDLTIGQIAQAINKSVTDVNRMISNLVSQELLDMKTITVADEIETIFDASPVFAKLDQLTQVTKSSEDEEDVSENNSMKDLVNDFERELGRFLSPFELEDLDKSLREDKTDPDLIREALKEAVFNGKTNWKYIQAILRNWRSEGISTLRQVEERKKAREDANLSQVSVSDDFLSAMNLWSD